MKKASDIKLVLPEYKVNKDEERDLSPLWYDVIRATQQHANFYSRLNESEVETCYLLNCSYSQPAPSSNIMVLCVCVCVPSLHAAKSVDTT